jgi:hypothetical protein
MIIIDTSYIHHISYAQNKNITIITNNNYMLRITL